jgi:hypothetical protein
MGWDSPLGTAVTIGLLYQLQMIDDDDDCEAIGGMKIGRGNWNTRRKPTPVPFCTPQTPHDVTRAWTRAAAVGSRKLDLRVMVFIKASTRLTACGSHEPPSHATAPGNELAVVYISGSQLLWDRGPVPEGDPAVEKHHIGT